MKISNCCGAYAIGNAEDFGICPECLEPCEFIDEENEDENSDEKDEK